MDLETLKTWLQAVNMLGTFALGCWLYLEKRSDKTNERVTRLADEVDDLGKAVTSLRAEAESAPSHADLSHVYESINELAEKVNKLVGESESQSQTLRQILNRIIEKGMP